MTQLCCQHLDDGEQNTGPYENKAGALTTHLKHSVLISVPPSHINQQENSWLYTL